MNIGNYCRDYRISCQSTLLDLCKNSKDSDKLVKSLSAFEHGRSTNFNHIRLYVRLSFERGEQELFCFGLMEVLNNE